MDLKTFKILFSNSKSSLLLGFYLLFYFLFERCTTLGNNPVIVARYLQYRAETSFKLIVIDRISWQIKVLCNQSRISSQR